MSSLNTTTNPLFPQALIESDLEKLNTAIQLWHYDHPGCGDLVREYKHCQAQIDEMFADDDAYEIATLHNAKTEYRLLYGREWVS